MILIYGMPYCDATKAAMQLLSENKAQYVLHDFKVQGLTAEKLKYWLSKAALEKLLNKRSTTWRSLNADKQAMANTETGAIELIIANTSLIKRPIIEWLDESITVGVETTLILEKMNATTKG